jgi:GNAT superfamily N-acetyltransferase
VEIRELRDGDVPGVVRLLRDAQPHQLVSEAGFRHRLASTPARARQRRWIAVDGGEVVASAGGQLHVYAAEADTGFAGTTVRADRRRHGLGGKLFDRVLAHLRQAGAVRVLAESGEADGQGFLERRGFTRGHTRRYSRVEPREVDFSELSGLRARKEADGFTVVPFTALRPEDVYPVDREATEDIPLDVPFTDMPIEEWTRQHWDDPLMTHEGSFAVLHVGRPVTITVARADGDRAINDMTGTLRAYRGRGLARLVKLCQLEWAARNGIAAVVTENDETNAPMLAVNTRLGYSPFLEMRSYVREPA